MTTKAQQKRIDGIQAVTDLAINPEDGYQLRADITVGKLMKATNELWRLGRTDRWNRAMKRWQIMIVECDDYEKGSDQWKQHLHWAVLQGGIYALHAAI